MTPSDDPVLIKRARIAKLVAMGQRLGYGAFGLAIVVFIVGFIIGFEPVTITIIVGSLLLGSAVLAPSIIFGYAVKAAEREDLGLPDGH